MGLFRKNPKKNSGTVGGGFTLTGTANGKQKVKAMRREWKAPRSGDLAHRTAHRPKQGK
jgi:hypothetical protein